MNLDTILSVLTAILFGHFTSPSSSASTNSMKVASTLNSVFSDDATAKRNIIVTFNKSASNVNNMFDTSAVKTQADFNSLHEKYVAELQLMSRESQEPIMEFLKSKKNKMESYWITNQVYIKDASKELVDALTSFGNVKEIREEKIYHIAQPIHEGEVIQGREGGTLNVLETSSNGKVKNVEWNIAKIKADQMWTAAAGETCVVGVIDTGVKADHEAFHKGMVKAWKDAVNNKKTPYDDNGHGTHVTGTIAGKNGIGVAPGVNTVHCKACTSSGSCPESALTSCCQFMTEQKPNIVSNSWGGPSGTADYEPVIEGWKALGIFSVFAAGNEGPACKTVGSPADYGNIGCSVGATTDSDGLADFSSRGESMNGNVAPTVSAPGKSILSAWIDSTTAYKKLSGTSMATPHVAGMYALLHSKNSKITFEQARSAIIHSCQTSSLQDPQLTCGSTSFKQIPNNMYGNGRIDCANALEILSKVDATGQMIV